MSSGGGSESDSKKKVQFREPPSEVMSVPHPSSSNMSSGSVSNTATRKKKVLIVHFNESVKRIAYTERAPSDAIERSIRKELGLAEESFSLLDGDGDSLVIDGSMEPGEVWLSQEVQEALKAKKKSHTIRANRSVTLFHNILHTLQPEKGVQHLFDPETGKWTQSPIQVKIDIEPFAAGSLRRAYYMKILPDLQSTYVAKISVDLNEERETYFQDVETQMYAKKWAEKFNSYKPPKKIDFVMASLITLQDRPNQPLWAIENFIEGSYRKHNNNYGYVSDAERNTPQAFSHYTYEASGHKMMICDIQGVGDLYTDPQMHTEESMPSLGKGNLGTRGFSKFMQTHSCNAICSYLKLPPVNAKIKDVGTRPENAVMSYQKIDVVNLELYANEHNGLMQKNFEIERQRLLMGSAAAASSSSSMMMTPKNESSRSCCCILL